MPSQRFAAGRTARTRPPAQVSTAVVAVVPDRSRHGLRSLGSGNGIAVENKTFFDLHFSVLLEDGWYTPIARARPHQLELILPPSLLPASKCTTGATIALAEDR